MNLSTKLREICVKLGTNNKPTYAVVAIAIAKGIFRPLFTLSDKNEKPETKKYTAIREGLTEVVAIPTYLACGELAGKIGKKLPVSAEKQAIASHNFMFLGVCTAALFVIPALTSLVIKPLMKIIQAKNKTPKNTDKHLDIQENSVTTDKNIASLQISETKPAFKNRGYIYNNNIAILNKHDMKVGL